MAGPTLINSLARGLSILRLLAGYPSGAGVTEMAERLEVDPSTAYRLLATLEIHGFVMQDGETKKYSIGYGVLEIAASLLRRLNVVDVAQPHLRAIALETGENTHVAVRERKSAISVAAESATGILRVETTIGTAEPLYCTATGKALLADMTHAELADLFGTAGLQRFTPHTMTSIDELETDLGRVRRLGYAVDEEELHAGVRCVAAPVRDHSGRIIASFGISSPAVRLTRDRIPEVAERICATAQAISAQLGYVQPVAGAAS